MKRQNVAIIGQGRSGRDIHGAHLVTDPERFRIVATVDLIEERRKRSAREYGCDVYADYHGLFKRDDLDLIVNATTSEQHVPVNREILEAGFNVLSEKPLAKRASEVDELAAVAKRARKVLAIFQPSRYAPCFVQLRKVIASGALGRIVHINSCWNGFARRWDWQTLQKKNGGSLLNTGPHLLDQALLLFGEGMPEVFCRMDRANTYGDAEDHVKLVLSGEGHPTIDIEISSCAPYRRALFDVYGTRGGLRATVTGVQWRYFLAEEAPEQRLVEEPLGKPGGTPAYCTERLAWRKERWPRWRMPSARWSIARDAASATGAFYRMIYRALATGEPLEVTPEQVRRQTAVIEECHRQNPQIY